MGKGTGAIEDAVNVTQVNRRAINDAKRVKEAEAEVLRANTAFATFEEQAGPTRITVGITHASGSGNKDATEAIVRIESELEPGSTTHATFRVKVNGDTEIGMSATEVANFLIKNKIFDSLFSLKINQFTGDVGEVLLARKMKQGNAQFHIYNKEAKQATATVNFSVVEGSVMSVQHVKTKNGLDLVAKVKNPSPPPDDFWLICEVKTKACHGDDAGDFTQYEGILSEKQEGAIDYAIERIENALKMNKENPGGYVMDDEKRRNVKKLLKALRDQNKPNGEMGVIGLVIGQGINEEYKLIENIACPEGMSSISLWFGDAKIVKDKFKTDIPFHSSLPQKEGN
ncbi:hypothetical protein NKK66_RS04930 [Escherichia coli]|uniref:Uncharacterized protein n=1 Tax=Escherichia coli TaxID=562 RepID=A0A0L7ANB0_ECOLX|nr:MULTISPECIES: hypothetical protein [Escherichia]EHQ5576196.1 hypothetical protein [Escherichia coli O2]EGB63244.1 hypothetical protein ERJG_00862 [Escherichia coli M863]EGE63726.1 hypothetical protein ECSTEC7V_2901 [Escherichia coli STEC_7v]EGO6586744.1 hypothetical protein [Escherichia coli]EGO7491472.1 hypothetical protein [Escherichia coli]